MSRETIPSLEEEIKFGLIKFKSDEPGYKTPSIEDVDKLYYTKDNYLALYLAIKYDMTVSNALTHMGINNTLSESEVEEFHKKCGR